MASVSECACVSEWQISQNGKCPRMASVSNGICLNGKCLHMATVPTGKCPKWQVSTGQVSQNGKCPQGNCLRMATVAWQVSDWQVSEGQVSASPTKSLVLHGKHTNFRIIVTFTAVKVGLPLPQHSQVANLNSYFQFLPKEHVFCSSREKYMLMYAKLAPI